ncbi:hypothetical protein, partial [Litorimonas sp.]|uniref:hypothetical protein n=1 Tax=Litorimonas sp. TaxID=1892381 RepID=UPI003A854619
MNCSSLTPFVQLAISGRALHGFQIKWTARRASAPAGDRNKYVFRKNQSSAAAIGTGAASYMAPTVAP